MTPRFATATPRVHVGKCRIAMAFRCASLSLATPWVALGCSLLVGDIPGPLPEADADVGVEVDAAEDAIPADTADTEVEQSDTDVGEPSPGEPPPGEPSSSTDPTDAGSGLMDASSLPDASTEQDSSVMDASADASVESPSPRSDAGDASPEPNCDGDEDGELSPRCGGLDCDDDDPDVNPSAGFFSVPSERRGFDYDCDGAIEKQFPETLSCDGLGPCDTERQGFLGDDPLACGEVGSWGHCFVKELMGLPASCEAERLEDRHVACR